MYKSKKIARVGDIVKAKDNGIDGYYMDIPVVIVDENNRREIKDIHSVVTKVKHGRKKNKGSQTITLSPYSR